MIYAIYVFCLLGSWTSVLAAAADKDQGSVASTAGKDQNRLAGLYVKDGNENGQLRFLASGSTSSTSNTGLNSALNQYITNKQDMLEQLRPTTGTTTATGTGLVTGTTTTGTGTATTGTGVVTTSTGGAIYVNLGNSGSSSSSSSSSTNAAINQVIYGSSPIADLLPQIVGQAAVSNRRRPGQVNRRRVPGNRRRVNKRRGGVNINNNNNVQRRRRRGNKRGKNKAQVMVVRPNRG